MLCIFKLVLRGFVTAFITLMKAVECSRNIGLSCYETFGVFICDEFIWRELLTVFIRLTALSDYKSFGP